MGFTDYIRCSAVVLCSISFYLNDLHYLDKVTRISKLILKSVKKITFLLAVYYCLSCIQCFDKFTKKLTINYCQ